MNELFVPYKESLKLKELWFDEPCFAWYGDTGNFLSDLTIGYELEDVFYTQQDMSNLQCTAPIFSQAFRFFRDKYKLHSKVDIQDVELDWYTYEILEVREGVYNNDLHLDMNFKSYEEAELECLRKLIQICKSTN